MNGWFVDVIRPLAYLGAGAWVLRSITDLRQKRRRDAVTSAIDSSASLSIDRLKLPEPITDLNIWERWELMPPLDYALPLWFDNGSLLDEVTTSCPSCQQEIKNEHAHGEIVRIDMGYQLRSVGWCERCNTISFGRAYLLATEHGFVCIGPPPLNTGQSPWPGDQPAVRTRAR